MLEITVHYLLLGTVVVKIAKLMQNWSLSKWSIAFLWNSFLNISYSLHAVPMLVIYTDLCVHQFIFTT